MKIVGFWVDGLGIEGGGVFPYAFRVLSDVLKNNSSQSGLQFVLIGRTNSLRKFKPLIKFHNIKSYCIKKTHYKYSNIYNKFISLLSIGIPILRIGNLDYRFFRNLPIDVLHIFTQTLPQHPFQFPVSLDLPYKTIITMHDVQHLHFPEYFTPQIRIKRETNYHSSMKTVENIVVSYKHVKEDLKKYYPVEAEKVKICPIPIKQIELKEPTNSQLNGFEKKYDQHHNILLYPAQTWPHKNHLRLLEAVRILIEKGNTLSLVCTGKKNDYFFDVIKPYLDRNNIYINNVLFTGLVPEEELYWLYKNAMLTVIPTKYEAGSFPLMEAMKLGSPVIASNVTSLPETIGSEAYLFDPDNPAQIADKITTYGLSDQNRTRNIRVNKRKIEQLMNQPFYQYFEKLWRTI